LKPRGVLAVANNKLLQLGRSPIVLVVVAAFGLVVASLPQAGAAPLSERVRQAGSWMLAAASALLLVTALLVPVAAGAPALRAREARLVGARATNLGHAAAAVAFLVFLAGVLALLAWIVVLLRFGNPDGRFEGAVVRRIAWRSEGAIVLRAGAPWTSEAIAPPAGTSIVVEMRPRLRFVAGEAPGSAPASAPAGGPRPAELELSWKADGGRTRTRRIPASTAGPIAETLELPAGGRSLVVALSSSAPGVEIEIERGGLVILGARAGCFAVIARALIVAACGAAVLGAVAHWFSNFVAPLIALGAALTLALATVVASGVAGWELPAFDPVAAFRRGHETAWSDVVRAVAVAAIAIGIGSAAAVGRREERAP
jgi:hypothetical protein